MSDTARPTVHLAYAGRRHDGKGKPTHAWVSPDEPERLRSYGGLKGSVIGGIYTVENDPEEPTTVYPSTLTYTGARVDEDVRVPWDLAHQAIIRQEGRDKAHRAAAKRTDLDDALEPLLEYVAKLRTRHDVYAVTAIVGERLVDAFYTRGKGKR